MINYVLKKINSEYKIYKRNIGEYENIRKNLMNFNIASYEIKNVGNISTIKMSAMFGLMKMESIILTPLFLDMPLFSYDRIVAMGNDTLLLELYDTQIETINYKELDDLKQKYKSLPDHSLGKRWYDNLKLSPSFSKKGKHLDSEYKKLFKEYFEGYLEMLKNAKKCDYMQKQEKVCNYVDGLFKNGGPSTDKFKQMIGEKEAYNLFSKYIFASKN